MDDADVLNITLDDDEAETFWARLERLGETGLAAKEPPPLAPLSGGPPANPGPTPEIGKAKHEPPPLAPLSTVPAPTGRRPVPRMGTYIQRSGNQGERKLLELAQVDLPPPAARKRKPTVRPAKWAAQVVPKDAREKPRIIADEKPPVKVVMRPQPEAKTQTTKIRRTDPPSASGKDVNQDEPAPPPATPTPVARSLPVINTEPDEVELVGIRETTPLLPSSLHQTDLQHLLEAVDGIPLPTEGCPGYPSWLDQITAGPTPPPTPPPTPGH